MSTNRNSYIAVVGVRITDYFTVSESKSVSPEDAAIMRPLHNRLGHSLYTVTEARLCSDPVRISMACCSLLKEREKERERDGMGQTGMTDIDVCRHGS